MQASKQDTPKMPLSFQWKRLLNDFFVSNVFEEALSILRSGKLHWGRCSLKSCLSQKKSERLLGLESLESVWVAGSERSPFLAYQGILPKKNLFRKSGQIWYGNQAGLGGLGFLYLPCSVPAAVVKSCLCGCSLCWVACLDWYCAGIVCCFVVFKWRNWITSDRPRNLSLQDLSKGMVVHRLDTARHPFQVLQLLLITLYQKKNKS